MSFVPTLCRNTPLARRRTSMFRIVKRAWKCFDLYVNTARSTRCCWRESAKRPRFGYMLAIKATDAIIAIWRWILPNTIEILNNLWLLWVERLCQKHIIIFAKMLTSFFFYLKKELWVPLKNKREGIASLSFFVVYRLISLCFYCGCSPNGVAFCMRTPPQQNLWSAPNSLHSLSLCLVNSPWYWGRRRAKREWNQLVKFLFSLLII